MMRINLLPHRQIKRAERQRQFTLLAGLSFVAGAAVVFMGYTFIDSRISAQVERNSRLEAANAKLDKEIAEIKDLKDKIQDLLARKQVVENLQSNRGQAVVVLDELSRKLPDGTYYKSIKQEGSQIDIIGIADNNARVASFVRNLGQSQWMESPNLVEIKSVMINTLKYNEFTLNIKLKQPQKSEEEGAANSERVGANTEPKS